MEGAVRVAPPAALACRLRATSARVFYRQLPQASALGDFVPREATQCAPLRCALAFGRAEGLFVFVFPPLKRRASTNRPAKAGLRYLLPGKCSEASGASWARVFHRQLTQGFRPGLPLCRRLGGSMRSATGDFGAKDAKGAKPGNQSHMGMVRSGT